MIPAIRNWTRDEMMKRVAFFRNLKGSEAWNEGADYQFVDVGPCDVVSFPPGVARRFMNVTVGEPDTEHLLLFIVAGDEPEAAYTPEANDTMRRGGDGLPSAVG